VTKLFKAQTKRVQKYTSHVTKGKQSTDFFFIIAAVCNVNLYNDMPNCPMKCVGQTRNFKTRYEYKAQIQVIGGNKHNSKCVKHIMGADIP
jgi:hypothetical protein